VRERGRRTRKPAERARTGQALSYPFAIVAGRPFACVGINRAAKNATPAGLTPLPISTYSGIRNGVKPARSNPAFASWHTCCPAYSQFRKGGTSVNSTKRLDQHSGRNFSPAAEWPADDLASVQVASSKGGIARSYVRSSEQIALTRCSHWCDIGSARGCELLAQTSLMGARDLPAS
jgi:hypothetical protein